jgi:hypothetical protein
MYDPKFKNYDSNDSHEKDQAMLTGDKSTFFLRFINMWDSIRSGSGSASRWQVGTGSASGSDSDPDLHQDSKSEPDRHQNDADPQHWTYNFMLFYIWSIFALGIRQIFSFCSFFVNFVIIYGAISA